MVNAEEKLRELGAVAGVIPVKPTVESARVLRRRTYSPTPLRTRLEKLGRGRAEIMGLPVIFPCRDRIRLRCRIQAPETRWVPPLIDYDMLPVKIRNLTLHVWGLWLEGDIISDFENRSKEGEKCVGEDCEPVSGSADLLGEFYHLWRSTELAKTLDEMRDMISRTRPLTVTDVSTHFEVRGWGEVIWDLIHLLLTGRIETYDGYDVTVSYTWLGEERTVKRHFDLTVDLPVEGDIRYVW